MLRIFVWFAIVCSPAVASATWLAEAGVVAGLSSGHFKPDSELGEDIGVTAMAYHALGGYRLALDSSQFGFEAQVGALHVLKHPWQELERFDVSGLTAQIDWREFAIPVIETIPFVQIALTLPTSKVSKRTTHVLTFSTLAAIDQPIFGDQLRIGFEFGYRQHLHELRGAPLTAEDSLPNAVPSRFVGTINEQRAIVYGANIESWIAPRWKAAVNVGGSTHWTYAQDLDEFMPVVPETTRGVAKRVRSRVAISYNPISRWNDLLDLDLTVFAATSQGARTVDDKTTSNPFWSPPIRNGTFLGFEVVGYFNVRDRFR